jgi:hypothetical protein
MPAVASVQWVLCAVWGPAAAAAAAAAVVVVVAVVVAAVAAVGAHGALNCCLQRVLQTLHQLQSMKHLLMHPHRCCYVPGKESAAC